MKKYLSVLFMSLSSMFIFVFLSINWIVITITNLGLNNTKEYTKNGINGWNLIGDADAIKGHSLYTLSAILLVILAFVLILFSIFLALQKAKIIKSNINLSKINIILLTIFVLLVTTMFLSTCVIASEIVETTKLVDSMISIEAKASLGAWAMLIVSIIFWLLAWVVNGDNELTNKKD